MLINKRKLIQLFLSELHGERQYLEFKVLADLDSERGKASIARAICGLSNSNSTTRSYMVFGIDNSSQTIRGLAPIDDQRFQQIIRNLLDPSPAVIYENVVFPGIDQKVVGLLTIYPSKQKTRIARNICKLRTGEAYYRCGSETLREDEKKPLVTGYEAELASLEASAAVSLEAVLHDVINFHAETHPEYQPRVRVFHDRHTVCYSGYSESDAIESESWVILAGEGIRLFWGALQYVQFASTEDSFIVTESIPLFWNGERMFAPIEKTTFTFLHDGTYRHEREFIFVTPEVARDEITRLLETYYRDLTAYKANGYREPDTFPRFEIYSHELLLAAINGEGLARDYLKNYLDGHIDGCVAESKSEAVSFLDRIEMGLAAMSAGHIE